MQTLLLKNCQVESNSESSQCGMIALSTALVNHVRDAPVSYLKATTADDLWKTGGYLQSPGSLINMNEMSPYGMNAPDTPNRSSYLITPI